VLVFSANDVSSLESYASSLNKHFLNPGVSVKLTDLAYTLSERRTKHFNRAYLIARSTQVDVHSLKVGKPYSSHPRIGLIFTGQGAQWPEMGKSFLETIPVCRDVVHRLDRILQTLKNPPTWRLVDELSQPRTRQHLQQPEFSQPLITALQLCILEVLQSWGVRPVSVVGHSSGEIAASVAAGLMTMEDAIKVAYFRGRAAADVHDVSKAKHGMLAVGLGERAVIDILQAEKLPIAIACINSPTSVTLSGEVTALTELKVKLEDDGKFVRLLQVDVAYHSKYVADIAARYHDLMRQECTFALADETSCKMFSSVTGFEIDQACNAEYWRANMESPVLFNQAVSAALTDEAPADFLIEVGPSGALGGPIKQIKESLGSQVTGVTYHAASRRDPAAVDALFEIAGDLFLSGAQVDLAKVNQYLPDRSTPSIIIDLPNYSWNHSVKLWYESESSKDWRFRRYPSHDLLGSKVLGTSWHAPSWKKVLKLDEVSWLKDHCIGGQVLFPAAGYVAMAIEAQFQTSQSRGFIEEGRSVHEASYRLRNVAFNKAMVFEGAESKIMLALSPEDHSEKSWSRFTISSFTDDEWNEHCTGLVALDEGTKQVASEHDVRPLELPTPAQTWYKAMRDVGYNFGELFQPQISIETVAGSRQSRAHISFKEPKSSYPQSPYSIHPVSIDGCLQAGAPSLWKGIRSAVGGALVPAMIDDMSINAREQVIEVGIAVTSAIFTGVGCSDEAQTYRSNISVYDHDTHMPLVQIKGLRYHKLDAHDDFADTHSCMRLAWKPDISYLTEEALQKYLGPTSDMSYGQSSLLQPKKGSSALEILVHQDPAFDVLEINLLNDTESMWISNKASLEESGASGQYTLVTPDASSLFALKSKFRELPNIQIVHTNITDLSFEQSSLRTDYGLVILRVSNDSTSELQAAITNVRKLLREDGYLFVHLSTSLAFESETSTEISSNESYFQVLGPDPAVLTKMLQDGGFRSVRNTPLIDSSSDCYASELIAQLGTDEAITNSVSHSVVILRLSNTVNELLEIKQTVIDCGFDVRETDVEQLEQINPKSTVLIIDEAYKPMLCEVDQKQWHAIRALTERECKILWITAGAQFQVTNPKGSLIYGMARVVRAENPAAALTVLDIEDISSAQSWEAINNLLHDVDNGTCKETEYVERSGIIYTSRVLLDGPINASQREDAQGRDVQKQQLHEHPSCVRMVCERPGILDSLKFTEVAEGDIPLEDDFVEIDMHAAGLNYKDVATSLGLVPENQYMLGLEGAGVIRRLGAGKRAQKFRVGQRVALIRRGSFGNKVQCPVEGVHPIPDWMTFEEAATLPVVYLAVIYGLYNLANIQKGHTVLVHSAAGGVGIAAIEICQYVGAEIFATVGSEEKRVHLIEKYGLSDDRIFSSRDNRFAEQIMKITDGRGVDIVLNSLTGDLLDASWRIIADCGTMVEIGKKDILARKGLSMEPFNRNASFRAIDMSHDSITRPVIASLMSQLFEMINGRHIRPIEPRTVFSYTKIGDAIRYMRAGTHMGKIIISREAENNGPVVPIRPAKRVLKFSDDRSYLIVGGLKGLCGSLAIYLARNGAKHIAVMARSGYDDEKSQAVLRDLYALGSEPILITGDVSKIEDVKKGFQQTSPPIGGIIQGAMVLRDKTYAAMTVEEFHASIACKVQGTWNLHTAVIDLGLDLSFFTMLSSISGLVGQKGQANYAAANTFLDSLASYRNQLSLPACSVNLGVIEDVGYISERAAVAARLNTAIWKPINESLLHRILRASILQQSSRPLHANSVSHMITGIPFPQPADAPLLSDLRFRALRQTSASGAQASGGDASSEVRTLLALAASTTADKHALLAGTVSVINGHFVKSLGLAEPMEPAKPLTVYGLDSLAAMEFRNWLRKELRVSVATLEIVSAKTLNALGENVCEKLRESIGNVGGK
jgi:acyl transferase domain-containing protein/NADPH:quinone reductase-like Zn-dependent oxidoreductase/aryl carrier-like protein